VSLCDPSATFSVARGVKLNPYKLRFKLNMDHLNVEIKAKCADQNRIREILQSNKADYQGLDHQIDTYFKVNHGRLKLREGNIENHLIYYERENQESPKLSKVILHQTEPQSPLKDILIKALGVLVIVDKQREIYFIGNVKFHLDKVEALGTFIEIEAIDLSNNIGQEKLQEQCQYYLDLFKIKKEYLISNSYSDLLLKK
jgi:predicted adenylyl cyclase CyaB